MAELRNGTGNFLTLLTEQRQKSVKTPFDASDMLMRPISKNGGRQAAFLLPAAGLGIRQEMRKKRRLQRILRALEKFCGKKRRKEAFCGNEICSGSARIR
ncbi:MAG: hypothetical protein SOX97_02455 [Sutterella sp.]|nr:hypothetical protein [Sutterella sp.]